MTLATPDTDVDVAIIGGGVNGTGVARDCALRGLRVALFERNDLGFGASGNNSGLIHGGPRYMTRDPDVTYSSCLDSGHIQQIAPHLLFRVPFLMPVVKGFGSRIELDLLDAFFSLYDRYQPLKRGKPHTRLDAAELLQIEPGLKGDFEGAVTFDEWGIDGVRLCVANTIDAFEHGAEVHVPATVVGLLRDEAGGVCGVKYRNDVSGELGRRTARLVVNATGAWSPLVARASGLPEDAVRLRPGKGIHVYFERRLTNVAIVTKAVDGRRIFVLPWQNTTAIATTDDDYYGDLDNVFATADEARYLIEGIARVFPAVKRARAVGTWAGVRPTLFEWGKPEDALSREHQILDHGEQGFAGLFSMVGGKLASYRLFAAEMSDRVAAHLGVDRASSTHRRPLPGGEPAQTARERLTQAGIDPIGIERLLYRHGSRAERILDSIEATPRLAELACVCEPVLMAEVHYVVEHEWARDVDAVARRTRLGLGACAGMRCAVRCGEEVARLSDRSVEQGRSSAFEFLDRQARHRLPILGPTQIRQEALLRATLQAQLLHPRSRS